MPNYNLRYAAARPGEVVDLAFEARSLGGALDIARTKAQGIWAELREDGRPICQLELVNECGVWLVGAPRAEQPSMRITVSAA